MFHLAALSINDELYHELKVALVLGYWCNGNRLTPEQRKVCQEVVCVRESYYQARPHTQQSLNTMARNEARSICTSDFFVASESYQ